VSEPYWVRPPLLPEEPPPTGATLVWRTEHAGGLWRAVGVELRPEAGSMSTEGWLLAWARSAGEPAAWLCLVAWLDQWEYPGHDGQVRGSNPRHWRTGWTRYDERLVIRSAWYRRRGAWTQYAAERLSETIEHARAGQIGWLKG
jgi:hypothetical protein